MSDLQPFLVKLPTTTLSALRERREEVGVPVSETIRRAIDAYLANTTPTTTSA